MSRLVLRASLRHTLRHPGLVLLSVIGIALGVGVTLGVGTDVGGAGAVAPTCSTSASTGRV